MVQVLHLHVTLLQERTELFGEFLMNAQGEDVVAGVRTPMHISEMEQKFPEAFEQFKDVCKTLENTLQRYAGHGVYCRTW